MKPIDSPAAFEAFKNAMGVNVSSCTPRAGVQQMLAFYQQVRAEGCEEPGADTLLFQWGSYDWGAGRHFELDITRQFIEGDAQGDDDISQLSLTFRLEPTAERVALGDGQHWCGGPAELGAFTQYVVSTAAFMAVANEHAHVELRYSTV